MSLFLKPGRGFCGTGGRMKKFSAFILLNEDNEKSSLKIRTLLSAHVADQGPAVIKNVDYCKKQKWYRCKRVKMLPEKIDF
jgi:hypothetical protein